MDPSGKVSVLAAIDNAPAVNVNVPATFRSPPKVTVLLAPVLLIVKLFSPAVMFGKFITGVAFPVITIFEAGPPVIVPITPAVDLLSDNVFPLITSAQTAVLNVAVPPIEISPCMVLSPLPEIVKLLYTVLLTS